MSASLLLLAAAAADPAITVTATRAPIGLAELGASVSILSQVDLDRLQAPLLIDVLRLQPGVSFSRNGGPGGFTAVRLRGAEGEQTVVVIDGVRVADVASPGGGYDFGGLPAAGIAQVEVLRGPQSLAWGSQAIGGVIAITTEAPGDDPAVTARAEGGTRASAYAVASASGRVGALGLAVAANYGRTDGISAASEARGATERDDFTGYGASLRGLLDMGAGLALDVRGRFQASRFGIDGFPPPAFLLADTPDRSRSDEVTAYAGLRWQSPDSRFDQQFGAELARIDRENRNPLATPDVSFRSQGRTWRLRYAGDAVLAPWLTATLGAEHESQRLETASPSSFNPDPDPFVASASLTGGFAQMVLRPAPGLTALAGIRHDSHSDFGGATTWGASVSYAPGEGPVRLKASAGEGFKAPTLFQLFSDFGNPDLQPERATGWDAGAEARLLDDRLTLGVTWFQRITRNQIDFVSCFDNPLPACAGRPFGTYDNIARARAQGVELEAQLRPTAGLTLGFAYTWLDARNRAAGAPNFDRLLPRRPRHTAALVADFAAPAGWSIGATLFHASDSFDNAANSRRIDDRVLLDLRGAVPLGRRFEAYARITNLTDAVYETASFFGQPGREFAAGVRARF